LNRRHVAQVLQGIGEGFLTANYANARAAVGCSAISQTTLVDPGPTHLLWPIKE